MIYVFDLMEFQVLAAARNVDMYYGFPGESEAAQQEVSFAVYQLTRSGILKQQGEELIIQEPIAGYMGGIALAGTVMVIDRGEFALPRQCVYYEPGKDGHSGRYLCLENSSTDSGRICLSVLDESVFFEQMEDLNQLPVPHLSGDMGEYDFETYWNIHMDRELREMLQAGFNVDTEQLLSQKQVNTVFSCRDKKDGRLYHRMALLDFPMEYCMVVQEYASVVKMERYSRETAGAILKTWWRE